jgi:hypothetical protein
MEKTLFFLGFFQYSFTLRLDIFKLATVNGPPQAPENEKNQNNRQGYQQVEDVHQRKDSRESRRESRKAFSTTMSELVAMPRPAAHAGSQPATASGIQAAL